MNKRAELWHGKWELKEDEAGLPAEPLTNIWTLILPRALVYGFVPMLVIVAVIWELNRVVGWQPATWLIVLIVFVINILTTTLLLKKFLPKDMLSYANAMKKENNTDPQPLAGYIIVEHVVPFFLLQVYINACVANRAFHHELVKAGRDIVPTAALVPDAVIIFILLALIHWLFSNHLTRGDVRLGRVEIEKLKNLNGWAGLGMIFGAGILIGVIYSLILKIGGVEGLTVGMAVLYKMAVIALSVIFGCWIGVRWGGAREAIEMKGE